MRFMTLYKPGKESDAPPTQEEMANMGRLIEDMARAGVLIATDGLQPSSKGVRVTISDGKFTVVDGPFAKCCHPAEATATSPVLRRSDRGSTTPRRATVRP